MIFVTALATGLFTAMMRSAFAVIAVAFMIGLVFLTAFLNFRRFKEPVKALSGGQRQSVAIARAILFNARILIMDEPTAALGPQETAQVGELIKELKKDGIGIFLISHDIHDVFDLADRVSVMKNGKVVGHARTEDVTKDEVLGMIIL